MWKTNVWRVLTEGGYLFNKKINRLKATPVCKMLKQQQENWNSAQFNRFVAEYNWKYQFCNKVCAFFITVRKGLVIHKGDKVIDNVSTTVEFTMRHCESFLRDFLVFLSHYKLFKFHSDADIYADDKLQLIYITVHYSSVWENPRIWKMYCIQMLCNKTTIAINKKWRS